MAMAHIGTPTTFEGHTLHYTDVPGFDRSIAYIEKRNHRYDALIAEQMRKAKGRQLGKQETQNRVTSAMLATIEDTLLDALVPLEGYNHD